MPTLSHAESWRLYSWWWDSHISPKNSKWLQEDLTDMDIRVKHMIKLIEEDGDSFAMRAEMYCKRRPELIKMVEEFYRAYRALAERYDHATRGLQQAHDTMTKEFHNRPFMSLDSQPAFLSAEFEPHSPRILLQTHNLFDPSDLLKEHSGLPSHCHTPRENGIYSEEFDLLRGKKGLKQVSEMFASSVGSKLSSFSVKSKTNAHIIQEESTKGSEFEPHDRPEVSKVENKDHLEKLNKFQDDDDSCNKQNQNFQFIPSIEFSAQTQEGEEILPPKYREYMLQFKEDNDRLHEVAEYKRKEAVEQLVLRDEHSRVLRAEAALESLKELHAQSQEKLEIVSSERQKGVQMLKEREMEIHILEGNLQQAKREFNKKTEEIDELRISFEEECLTLQKLQWQCESDMNLLVLEIQRRSHQWEEAKSRKQDLEETVQALELMINNLHYEISHMEKVHLELEDELRECAVEKEALQLQNIHSQEKVNDLELKQVDAIQQLDTLTDELQSLQGTVEILQDENLFMKDVCNTREEENHLLFDSLKDANLQLVELKGDVEVLDGSITSLRELNSKLEAENSMLRYQKDAIQGDARNILEENVILESSLSDVNLCMVEMEGKIRYLEDTCQSLFGEKLVMENELHVLMLQVDCIAQTLKSWEKEYMELHDKNLSLEAEKDSTICRESELEILLNSERREKEIVLHSSNAQIAALKDRIYHLDAEVESTQVELLNKGFEAFVFQNCLFDQRVKNIIPFDKQEKLEHEFNDQRGVIDVLSDHVGNLEEQIFSIGRTIGVNGSDHKVISERIKKLCDDSLVMEDENHKLIIEKSVGEIFLRQFTHNAFDLIASIDNRVKEILGDKENQKSREEVDKLQNRKTEIRTEEDEENSGLLREFEMLMADSHHAVVCGKIFEEKVLELARVYEDFELRKEKENLVANVEMASRIAYDKEHCGKCGIVEEEVIELKTELNRCLKLVASINDKVSYFEDCIHISTKHQDLKVEPDVKFKISNPRSPANVADELQKLMDKLDEIQRDVIETEDHGMVSTFISKSGRETIGHTKMSNFEKEIRVICTKDHQTRRDGTENSNYIDEIILKDIQLDSISSISREKGYISPYENDKNTYATGELEMKIVQVPKKGMNSHRDWSDVIQRLSVDTQRLASLQTGVLDVKRRLESIERSNYPKESECHAAKEQLKQVENSVVQLIGKNHKLVKRANNSSSSPVYNDIKEREDVCNQQKRGSRNIGRWELELQKAQCALLEFEEGIERQRNRAATRGSRVVLSDYLFGRAERKKTQQFCGCVDTKDNCHVRR